MAPSDYKSQKLNKNEAKKHIRFVLSKYPDSVWFSKHSLEELEKDDLATVDALNVLKSPDAMICDDGELERGSYRYRIETANIVVVVAFSCDGRSLTIVTAWDKRK